MDKRPTRLSRMFSLLTLLTLVLTVLFSATLAGLLFRTGVIVEQNRIAVLCIVGIVSILVGTAISNLAGRYPIAAIRAINDAAKEITKGNFQVSLNEDSKIEELHEMAHSFNLMAKELAGTEILRNDFVENVSHEFKTPLSAIEGYATLLQTPGLPEEKRIEYTRRILLNTGRLSSLTSNVLLLSRLEHQGFGIDKQRFCLDEQIREVVLSLEEQWAAKDLELEIDMDSADYSGSRDLLVQVWQNLLNNAIKFVPAGGKIRILLRRSDDSVEVQIADNGAGMSPDVQRRIFEKFYQGDHSHASSGNGLGLALVKRIVDLHGGKISVSSTQGEGTAFCVLLPVSRQESSKQT